LQRVLEELTSHNWQVRTEGSKKAIVELAPVPLAAVYLGRPRELLSFTELVR
jgi:hypothetical protein